MKKVLKIIGIAALVIVVLTVALLLWLSKLPSVPDDYTEQVSAGGDLEARYLAMGSHAVGYFESASMNSFEKYEIYYPADITKGGPFPVVVFVNGTGVKGSKYPALQEHMASWGFITIATEEEYAWNGFSAEMCVRYLEILNAYEEAGKENVFYHNIDLDNIGITGHSQGGIGVINAITEQRHADSYRAAVILSCGNGGTGINPAMQWEFDDTLIETPTMLMGSTGQGDALLASLESVQRLYNNISSGTPKVMARRNDVDHGQMLYYADGYVTAWFMWHLRGDEEATKAFVGDHAELMGNSLYQDQQSHFVE